MFIATPEQLDDVREQAVALSTKPGSEAWRLGVEAALRAGDVDRWAREYLRAIGWAAAPDRRLPRTPSVDSHRLRILEAVEETCSPPSVYGVVVRRLNRDFHALCVRAGERDVFLYTIEAVPHE